ncbi:MAG: hypothetical protein GX593_12040 [Actinomycetales bacterium]|nr:hypothetical protein [Actinomycetales bacterium]
MVSLTTFGVRTARVHLAIESIGRGAQLPSRLVLWLDDPGQLARLPRSLRRLERRGLEVRQSANYGPHTKYFPYVMSLETHVAPLVTADDDTVYPHDWLTRLVAAHRTTPDHVVCHRARRLTLDADGEITPYVQWRFVSDAEPSPLNLATGVAGVLYPVTMLHALREAGENFQDCAPRTDDIWLHAVALRAGVPVRQIDASAGLFPLVPSTQAVSLLADNVHGTGNDDAVRRTYGSADLALLRTAAATG